ncbi:MAG: hypothetical protein C0622_06000 [Desulfuromonas sp.]|nr:MAG: hypothetical protein C0622_06000 [Desulfuromonas sp.]
MATGQGDFLKHHMEVEMKTFTGFLAAFCAVVLLGLVPAVAQAAIYMKVEGVPGESKDSNHRDWIDVMSVSHQLAGDSSTSFATGGRTAARATFGDFIVIKSLDKATPKLNLFGAKGEHISRVVIERTLSGGDMRNLVYLQYILDDVVVSGVETDFTADPHDGGREKVALSFGKITCIYTEMDERGMAKGNVAYSWSVARGMEESVGQQTSGQSSGQVQPGTLIRLKEQQAPTRLFRLNQ